MRLFNLIFKRYIFLSVVPLSSAFVYRISTSLIQSKSLNKCCRQLPLYVKKEMNEDGNDVINIDDKGFLKRCMNVAKEGFGTKARNVASTMCVGDTVVPLCSNLEMRASLAQRGIYPGVDYKVCELEKRENEPSEAWIQPAYPLRPHLERSDWPVYVRPEEDVPLWLSQDSYNAGTALGTFILALTNLSIAAVLAFLIRFVYVPTESMIPALMPGDVVLVTRSIPPVFRPHVGDVAFFDPPEELDRAIAESSVGKAGAAVPTKGKQFLKRVVAIPGEKVGVRSSNPVVETNKLSKTREAVTGEYLHPEVFPPSSWDRPISNDPLKNDEFFVAGDNGARSVDSRVWGPLREKYIIGTVKWVVYPPEHFGPVMKGHFEEL